MCVYECVCYVCVRFTIGLTWLSLKTKLECLPNMCVSALFFPYFAFSLYLSACFAYFDCDYDEWTLNKYAIGQNTKLIAMISRETGIGSVLVFCPCSVDNTVLLINREREETKKMEKDLLWRFHIIIIITGLYECVCVLAIVIQYLLI